MMKKIFILTLSSIFFLFGCGGSQYQFELYNNLEHRFHIYRPKDWVLIDHHNRKFFSQFRDLGGFPIFVCFKDPNFNYPPFISMALMAQTRHQTKPEDYVETIDKLCANNKGIVERPEITTLGDSKIVKFTVKLEYPVINRMVTTESYCFFKKNNVFLVGTHAYSEEYESYKPMFEEIVTSVKFF